MEDICSDLAGSETGELFYKCMSETAGYTHWSGPFFTAFFLALLIGFFVGVVSSA